MAGIRGVGGRAGGGALGGGGSGGSSDGGETLWDAVELAPALLPGLTWLNCSFQSPRGLIAVSYSAAPGGSGGALRLSATVPPGVRGVLVLPRSARRLALRGGEVLQVED